MDIRRIKQMRNLVHYTVKTSKFIQVTKVAIARGRNGAYRETSCKTPT